MKRTLVCLVILVVVFGIGLSGCSLFGGGSGIQPGRPKSDKPGTGKPPAEMECKYTVVQRTTPYPPVTEIIAGDVYTYEYDIASQNKTGKINMKLTNTLGLRSISPLEFSLTPGTSQKVTMIFVSSPWMKVGSDHKSSFTITPDCKPYSQVVDFTAKSILPYSLKLIQPQQPFTQLKKGGSMTYLYEITNLSKMNEARGFRIWNSNGKMIKDVQPLSMNGKKVFYFPFFMSDNAETNKIYTYTFKIDYGKLTSGWGGTQFTPLMQPEEVSFTIKAVD